MFILATLQMLAGILRPHVPGSGEQKSLVRKAWEMGHRISGICLLACGFWQMREGIYLFAQKYSVSVEDEDKVAIAYWVWIGIMTAAILLGVASKLGKNEEPGDQQAPSGNETNQSNVSLREGEENVEVRRNSAQEA